MRKSIKEMKQEQIGGAKEIKDLRLQMKDAQRGKIQWKREYWQESVRSKSWEWRHRHIAYCLLRGKTYEQIESKVRLGNEPDMEYIQKIMLQYEAPTREKEENGAVLDGGEAKDVSEALCVG